MKTLQDLTATQLEAMLPVMGKKARVILRENSWEITEDEGYTRKEVKGELGIRFSTIYYGIHSWPSDRLSEALSYKIDAWFRLARQGRHLPHLEISATPRDYSFWYSAESLQAKLNERLAYQGESSKS